MFTTKETFKFFFFFANFQIKTEYLGADPYGQPLSSLHHAPLHHYNQLTGLRPTQDQLGIHRTHREAELQGHVVSLYRLYYTRLQSFISESTKKKIERFVDQLRGKK